MEALLELQSQIKTLGDELKETSEKRSTATDETISDLDQKLADLATKLDKLDGVVKDTERNYLPGVEWSRSGDPKKFSWGRAMQVVAGLSKRGSVDKENGAGYELEVFEQMDAAFEALPKVAKTAMNAGTDLAGGFLVPLDVMEGILPELEAVSIARRLGVTSMDGLSGNVRWIKDNGGITIEFIDTEEEETAAESVTTLASIEVTPHVAVGIVPVTWSMLNQPAVAIDSFIRERLATKIALKEDEMVFLGDAANSEPRGITNTAGIGTIDWTGGAPIAAQAMGPTAQTITPGLRAHVKELAKANAFQGARSLGWALSTDSMFSLMNTQDSDNRDIFQVGQATPRGVTSSILGFPAEMSEQLDAADADDFILYGDFAQVILPHWGTLAFAASDSTETNFRKLRVSIRAVMAFDVGVLEPKAFVRSANYDSTLVNA